MARPPSPATIFIRKHPTLPAAEVVALAAKAGITTNSAQVNKVRDRDRARAKAQGKAPPPKVLRAKKAAAPKAAAPNATAPKKRAARKAAKPTVAPKAAPAAQGGSLEAQLRRIALEIGLRNAEAVLADVRSQLARLV